MTAGEPAAIALPGSVRHMLMGRLTPGLSKARRQLAVLPQRCWLIFPTAAFDRSQTAKRQHGEFGGDSSQATALACLGRLPR